MEKARDYQELQLLLSYQQFLTSMIRQLGALFPILLHFLQPHLCLLVLRSLVQITLVLFQEQYLLENYLLRLKLSKYLLIQSHQHQSQIEIIVGNQPYNIYIRDIPIILDVPTTSLQ